MSISKYVLITGVSTGIGNDITSYLIDRGFYVFGSVRKDSDMHRLTQQYRENFTCLKFDVTNTEEIKVAFKNFPLPFHNQAKGAAAAGLCANDQGTDKFWKMHDAMFENQTKLGKDGLAELAKKIGLDMKAYSTCVNQKKHMAAVEMDIAYGKKVGVKSTPTFYVNGKLINGAQPVEVFSELIDEELAR